MKAQAAREGIRANSLLETFEVPRGALSGSLARRRASRREHWKLKTSKPLCMRSEPRVDVMGEARQHMELRGSPTGELNARDPDSPTVIQVISLPRYIKPLLTE